MSTHRRSLTFASLDDVIPEIDRLLAGHHTVGRWSLGQIFQHLALAIRLPMEGVPVKFPYLIRRFFGPLCRSLSFRVGWIPEGVRVPAVYLPPPGSMAGAAAEELRTAIERIDSFTGKLDEHPLLGRLSRAGWERFHCLHCAHHLSFAIPEVSTIILGSNGHP